MGCWPTPLKQLCEVAELRRGLDHAVLHADQSVPNMPMAHLCNDHIVPIRQPCQADWLPQHALTQNCCLHRKGLRSFISTHVKIREKNKSVAFIFLFSVWFILLWVSVLNITRLMCAKTHLLHAFVAFMVMLQRQTEVTQANPVPAGVNRFSYDCGWAHNQYGDKDPDDRSCVCGGSCRDKTRRQGEGYGAERGRSSRSISIPELLSTAAATGSLFVHVWYELCVQVFITHHSLWLCLHFLTADHPRSQATASCSWTSLQPKPFVSSQTHSSQWGRLPARGRRGGSRCGRSRRLRRPCWRSVWSASGWGPPQTARTWNRVQCPPAGGLFSRWCWQGGWTWPRCRAELRWSPPEPWPAARLQDMEALGEKDRH